MRLVWSLDWAALTRTRNVAGDGDGILGPLIAVMHPSCPLEVKIGESPDAWCIHNTTVTACVVLRRMRAKEPPKTAVR